jgi:hypothetical protein
MVRVEVATPAMFDAIHPLLVMLDPGPSKEVWRNLVVDHGWKTEENHIGYVLVAGQEIVGFIGALFSRRIIDGKEVKLCNCHSWVVKEAFRGSSLSLVMPVLKLKGYTVTALTVRPGIRPLWEKLGFKVLDRNVRLLFPRPVAPRLTRRDIPDITADRRVINETLLAADRPVFADHLACACRHVIVRDAQGYCHLAFANESYSRFGRQIPYSHIHYISNRDLFLRHLGRINLYFLKTFGSWFLAVDERLIGDRRVSFSRTRRLTTPRYYRGDVLAPQQIDNLYTEMVAWSRDGTP